MEKRDVTPRMKITMQCCVTTVMAEDTESGSGHDTRPCAILQVAFTLLGWKCFEMICGDLMAIQSFNCVWDEILVGMQWHLKLTAKAWQITRTTSMTTKTLWNFHKFGRVNGNLGHVCSISQKMSYKPINVSSVRSLQDFKGNKSKCDAVFVLLSIQQSFKHRLNRES